jgi:paired amphipathic helix protein Sin3a
MDVEPPAQPEPRLQPPPAIHRAAAHHLPPQAVEQQSLSAAQPPGTSGGMAKEPSNSQPQLLSLWGRPEAQGMGQQQQPLASLGSLDSSNGSFPAAPKPVLGENAFVGNGNGNPVRGQSPMGGALPQPSNNPVSPNPAVDGPSSFNAGISAAQVPPEDPSLRAANVPIQQRPSMGMPKADDDAKPAPSSMGNNNHNSPGEQFLPGSMGPGGTTITREAWLERPQGSEVSRIAGGDMASHVHQQQQLGGAPSIGWTGGNGMPNRPADDGASLEATDGLRFQIQNESLSPSAPKQPPMQQQMARQELTFRESSNESPPSASPKQPLPIQQQMLREIRNESPPPSGPKQPPMQQQQQQQQQQLHHMQSAARLGYEGTIGYGGPLPSHSPHAQQQQPSARPGYGDNLMGQHESSAGGFGSSMQPNNGTTPPAQQQDRGLAPPNPQSLMHGGQQPQQHQYRPNAPPQHHPQQQQQRNSPGPYNMDHQQQQPPQGPPQGASLFGHGMGQAPQGPPGGMRELRVEDALLYLDDVKREFKDRPAIYNEFLAIMKNFKSQEVDTPGVIARVSKLFRGYNNLILGFNTFLPDGYKISLADLERAEARRVAEEQAAAMQAQGSGPKAKKPKGQGKRAPKPAPPNSKFQQGGIQGGLRPVAQPPSYMKARQMNQKGSPGSEGTSPMQLQQQQGGGQWGRSPEVQSPHGMPPPNHQPQQKQPAQPPRAPFNQQPTQQPPPQQHQAVEFDHAISYVTTIKKRFASDPNTYHSFLEILHTYQKEQRGIKEVLEQVAHLFQDHPDLLKEFTFFLPDAVQEQAKERLHRAAAESESRIAAQRQQQLDQYHQKMGASSAAQQQQIIDMTRSQMGLPEADLRGRKRQADGQQLPMVQQQPESYVYNSAVERQFFDSAREALTSYSRDGGQAWAEFLKCLDMYAQEILSRSEMLNFVEPLLGKRNNNLFEEFKRILAAAGSPSLSTQLMDDSWHSVPLAEIDFSRCRRCSPSYRALPRDYPAHPCSMRSDEEAKVLNDVWVSLPVGSEESYTFRHMRRNTYEETLFRVEDERFEIDMTIDSNDATLQRLEPIAEEIALLAQEDVIPADLGIKPQVEGAGLGGKRFQYTFDKKILGVIHRNVIARIYGDSGQEMLDLLIRNPTVTVPLVVQRLRQKSAEWRSVRDRMNRQWKELAENNYYKSLDHRSLTWRTTDKRAISTRTLIAELKDRAANGGHESKEAYRQRLDKFKEEHGSFFEVTVGDSFSQDLDLTFLPKPDRRLFTPHLTLVYKNVSWAQRDAYRIMAFALERGPISPADKERCHRLWVEFLGPWFDLSFNWMQKPAVTYQESSAASTRTVRAPPASVVSEDDDESLDEDPELVSHMVTEELQTDTKDKGFTDHHPLPAGAHVSTLYGEGKIVEFRRSDHIYAVRLGFGAIGYLRPATVLCSMLPVEKSAYTRQLRAEDRTKLARPNDQLAFGTQSLYLFFRLHEILVRRLNTAKRLAYSVGDDRALQSMVEQMPNVNPKAVGRRRYEAYLSLVYALLDGGVGGAAEGGKYEDRVRSLLGHGGYELATMDKLISHIWKDIQTMANDETMWNLVQLYRRHMLAGSFQPGAFRQEAAYLSDGEPMYAFQHCPLSGSDESVLHVEYLGVMDDEDDDANIGEEIEPVMEQNASKRPKR